VVETAAALEHLAEVAALERSPRQRRMLVIVNPYATTMSDRVKNLVVYALQGRYDVQAVDTQAKGTRSSCAARPRTRATTSWSPSAATGPSTRPPTGSSAPPPR
jgi:BRCT domain type II-containing protein